MYLWFFLLLLLFSHSLLAQKDALNKKIENYKKKTEELIDCMY